MKRLLILFFTLFSGSSAVFALPAIEKAQLSNGATVLLMEAHNVPMVVLKVTVPAGSAFDPKGRGGTANMLAAMLSDHTAHHNQEQWADLLDQDAIHLGAAAGYDTLSFSLTVLKDALTPGLDALAESLLQPGWDQKRFDILHQDSIAAARKSLEEPGVRAAEAAAAMLFQQHPYGHLASGSLASLQHITMVDLKQLYRQQVKPASAVIAVSGDITMKALLPMLEARLQQWRGHALHPLSSLPQPKELHGQQRQIEMPTSQTMVRLTRLGIARSDPSFLAALVMNHILGGGGFSSRLMEEVREKRGLVYGVYSYFSPLTVPGAFVITLQTRNNQAQKAEAVVRDVLKEMAAGNIQQSQLQASKENLIGSFAQRIDSNRERVNLISMIGVYHLPLDYLSGWQDRLARVSLDDVKKQAHRFLQPEAWNRVIVGQGVKAK